MVRTRYSENRKSRELPQKTKIFFYTLAGTFFFIIAIWLTRPLWHWLFMMFYVYPVIIEVFVIATIISGLYWHFIGHDAGTIFVVIAIIGLIAGGVFAGIFSQTYLSDNLAVSEISELPNSELDTIRIMPLTVSERYARDALQYPRYKLGTGDIVFINRTPHWEYTLIPDGFINVFKLKNRGAVYVDMTTTQKNTQIIEQYMQIGEGMAISDWISWKLYKEQYWVTYEDTYVIPYENDLYIAVPIVSYSVKYRDLMLYTVPQWGGIALINSAGNIQFLKPSEALENPVLKEQKLFPEKLTRYYVNSFRYKHGIVNKWFYHVEQLEIAEVPGQKNEQPFLINTDEGMKWIITCEPYGEAHGIFKIYVMDARTGAIQSVTQSKQAALLGPVKSTDYLRKANPIVDWSRFILVEPIPVILNNTLYWHVRVVPDDASGISYTAMVDALTTDVAELKTEKELRDYITGEHITDISPEFNEEAAIVIIIQEDGIEKNRIEVYPNQTFVVIPIDKDEKGSSTN